MLQNQLTLGWQGCALLPTADFVPCVHSRKQPLTRTCSMWDTGSVQSTSVNNFPNHRNLFLNRRCAQHQEKKPSQPSPFLSFAPNYHPLCVSECRQYRDLTVYNSDEYFKMATKPTPFIICCSAPIHHRALRLDTADPTKTAALTSPYPPHIVVPSPEGSVPCPGAERYQVWGRKRENFAGEPHGCLSLTCWFRLSAGRRRWSTAHSLRSSFLFFLSSQTAVMFNLETGLLWQISN